MSAGSTPVRAISILHSWCRAHVTVGLDMFMSVMLHGCQWDVVSPTWSHMVPLGWCPEGNHLEAKLLSNHKRGRSGVSVSSGQTSRPLRQCVAFSMHSFVLSQMSVCTKAEDKRVITRLPLRADCSAVAFRKFSEKIPSTFTLPHSQAYGLRNAMPGCRFYMWSECLFLYSFVCLIFVTFFNMLYIPLLAML